jgi:hypothetical protein
LDTTRSLLRPAQTLPADVHPDDDSTGSRLLPISVAGPNAFTAFLKPSNPKDLIGSGKLPLHLWPETATAVGCLGLLDGMLKYGRSNWRAVGVRASIYVDALRRHTNAYFEGEDNDPDSGLPHLSHMLACIAILVDSKAAGNLTDDRMFPGGYRNLVTELTPLVDTLKQRHAGKSPKHYTIADTSAS